MNNTPTTGHQQVWDGFSTRCRCVNRPAAGGRYRLLGCWWVAVVIAWGSALPCRGREPQETFDRVEKLEYDEQTQEWVAVQPPSRGTAAGDLHAARLLIKNEDYKKAVKALKKWEKEYGVGDANFPAVLIALARAQTGRRDYYEAYETLQRFLSEFGGTELTPEALRQEFIIAEVYLRGVKRRFLGLRILPADDVGLRILDDISASYADGELAELAIKTKADYFKKEGDHESAQLEYSRILTEYPHSRYYSSALFQAAVAALAIYAGTDYDDAPLIEAQSWFTEFLTQYPDDAEREDVRQTLETIRQERAMKDFSIGQFYERTRHIRSAVYYYKNVVEDWPETVAATRAAARLEALGAFVKAANSPTAPPAAVIDNLVGQ